MATRGDSAVLVEPGVAQRDAPRTLDRGLWIAMLVIALIGTGVASYLTYVHYAGLHPLCLSGGGGCEKVQSSTYSKLAGVPVAVIGLVGYVTILASLFIRGENGRLAGVVLTLIGFGFSVYLTYREIATIKAICQWCVSSAVLMTLLMLLAITRYLRAEPEL
jgi:uncharacterized membrane protein